MRKMWDPTKAVQKNLSDLGLAFDANSVIKCSSTKAGLIERAKKSDGNPWKKIEEQKEKDAVNLEIWLSSKTLAWYNDWPRLLIVSRQGLVRPGGMIQGFLGKTY